MIYFAGGFIMGIGIALIINKLKTVDGVFKIDHSNPEKDIYRLDLENIILDGKTKLVLKVDHHANLTQ